ncbi:MAG: OB-fold nucleic acid binding domain-containing protein [Candidatus Altiarchaeota archaeon]
MATNSEISKLIKKISKASGKTESEIQQMIEKRKEATHGLLSDYGALYAIAKEFSVPIEDDKDLKCSKISEISPDKLCNVVARIAAIYPKKEFKRKDGTSGKFSSILLMDDSGQCRLVLWNEASELINKVKKGDTLMIRNVNCKTNLSGNLELHATSLTHFTINPKIDFEIPKLIEEIKKISDIKIDEQNINVICRVSSYREPTEFSREDGSSGLRASFIAEDETGSIRVVLWGENAKTEIKRGDIVKIENAYSKEGLNQEVELHVGNLGRIFKTEDRLNLPELPDEKERILKINEIAPNLVNFTTFARVLNIFQKRPYANGNFASLIVADTTGSIRAVLWDEKSNIVDELKKGDALKFENVYSRANLNNEPEIHVGKFSDVSVIADITLPKIEEIEKILIKEKNIADLNAGDRYVKIKGRIVDIHTDKKLTYMTCPNCNRKIQNLGLGWYCDICQEDVEPQPNLILSFTIEDDTGSIRAVSFREQAEKILGVDIEDVMNIIGEAKDELAPIRKLKDEILNTEISLIGRVRYSTFSDRLEFLVSSVE